MKMHVVDPESEARLASVEDTERGWTVGLEGKAGTVALDAAAVELVGDAVEARLESGRVVISVHHGNSTGIIYAATPLGNLRVRVMRAGSGASASNGRTGARALKSSMPGKVLKLLCKAGDTVEAGQALLVIEAMKMENEIRSPQAGRIEEVSVQPGQSVLTGDPLLKIGAKT